MKQMRIKNHYVPECYLKRWKNTEGKVYVYRTLVNHANVPMWRQHTVSAIAYQKHLYTQIHSGNESDQFESWLDKNYESPANSALEKVCSEARLNTSDWETLIKFLACQDVRTPARLFEHLQRSQTLFPKILDESLNQLKESIEKEDIESLRSIESKNIDESFPLKITKELDEGSEFVNLKAETYMGRSSWIYSMMHLLENTRAILHEHHWSIVKPAEGYHWPTSDNPVVKLNYYSPGKYDLRGGWGVKKANIFFPLSPDYAMFVQIGDKPAKRYSILNESLTRDLIKYAIENSHRTVFSHIESEMIPSIKQREVDPDKLSREKSEIENWHMSNSELEKVYVKSNQNA